MSFLDSLVCNLRHAFDEVVQPRGNISDIRVVQRALRDDLARSLHVFGQHIEARILLAEERSTLRFDQLRDQLQCMNHESTSRDREVTAETCQASSGRAAVENRVAATQSIEGAVTLRLTKARSRRLRRKRCSESIRYSRGLMLQARASTDSDHAHRELSLYQRIAQLESSIAAICEARTYRQYACQPSSGTLPAHLLEQQCCATRLIQRAWRNYRARAYRKEGNLIHSQVEVEDAGSSSGDAFSCSNQSLAGMSYLTVRDGVRLRCASLWHGGYFTFVLDNTLGDIAEISDCDSDAEADGVFRAL
eukprot:TRINITY_DN11077_c0_g1_i1.p1 TRINITY_DN11077_c0_g1~~TRINITY_DN11077_c0_g1_i1.p1  ORF type:complete len:306 (-),score=25.71 TRINITY_DN11077_c0_g1_i1:18-935(-)